MNRRDFGKTIVAGFGATACQSLSAAESRKLKIGCTALIWGALPRTPDNLTAAVRDMASLGFHGFETFASICLLYTSPSPRDGLLSRMPSSA